MHVKKGDNIIVIRGKDRGKTGHVTKSLPKIDKVVIEGVNLKNKRIKSKKQAEAGQMVAIASPIHVSNVKLVKVTKTKSSKK